MAKMDKNEMTLERFVKNYQNYYHKEVEIEFPSSSEKTFELLKSLCFASKSPKYYWAWEIILNQINAELLFDDILSFLISNKIQLEELGHLNLSSEWLLRIYKSDSSCIEAIQTVGLRYLHETSSVKDFCDFINEYIDEALYDFLLKQVIYIEEYSFEIVEKYQSLVKNSLLYFSQSSSVNELARDIEKYLMTLASNEQQLLESALQSNDYWQLLALSRNSNCSSEILKCLLNVKNIKYCRRIKENARLLLKKKK